MQVTVVADSMSPSGVRLTTIVARYPRFIHAEVMTHRVFSRNSASSRAIPTPRFIENVLKDPVLPVMWGRNKSGMQADEELDKDSRTEAEMIWLQARYQVVQSVQRLLQLGVHKQIANRLLEPWTWMETVISSTEWDNFFWLRCNKAAQPEMRKLAETIRDALDASTPTPGTVHLPFVTDLDRSSTEQDLIRLAVGRLARVSYLNHFGVRDPAADLALHDRIVRSEHYSPTEHIAEALTDPNERCGNFRGWCQYRHAIDLRNMQGLSHAPRLLRVCPTASTAQSTGQPGQA